MSDPHEAPNLHDLLERATDRVTAPDLADHALTAAKRRTRVRRAAVIGGAAAAVAAAVVAGTMVGMQQDADSTRPPIATTGTPTPTPTPTGPTTIDSALIQPRWDPREVDDLPPADLGIDLPATIAPPDAAPPLSEAPTGFSLVAVQRRTVVKVLSADGYWSSVPLVDAPATVRMSPGGQQLAIGYGGRVEVWNLSTGTMRQIDEPKGFEGWDFASLSWIDEATLLLDDAAGGWLVDVASADATRVPYPREDDYWWAVDPAGAVVESRDFPVAPGFVDWAGGEPRDVLTAAVGHLAQLGASRDLIAGTAFDGTALDGFAAFVLDRATGEPTAVLPLRDFEGNYSNWGLSIEALRADGTVLMNVASVDKQPGTGEERLVAWDPETGSLGLVASFVTRDTDIISLSRDVLG